MNTAPYLICRDGIYYFRKVCPKALQPLLGRKEITKSLRTASKHLAKRLAITMATDIESIWSEETGKVTNKKIIEDIKRRCKDIEENIHLSNSSESESRKRIKTLLSKI